MKKFILSISALLIIGGGGFGVWFFLDSIKDKTEEEKELVSEAEDKVQTKKVQGVQDDLQFDSSVSESSVHSILHKMTHQKVVADDKWGALEMTEDRIKEVHEMVKNSDYSSKQGLMEILDKWIEGDFSKIDEDHNFVWRLQGGSIGVAYGIMSEEQEKIFIENNFR